MNKILKIPVFRGENRERIYKKSWRGLSAANRLSVCDLSDALYINTEKLPLLMSEKHSAPADMSGTLRIGNTQYTYGKSFPCDDDINLADAEKYCLLGKVLEYECPSTQPGNFYYDASRMIVHRVICGGSENGYENPLGFYSAGDYVFALYERSFFATQELRYYQGFCECLPYWSQFVTKKHSLDLHKQIVADVLSGDGLKQFLLYSETTNYINETNPSANNCTPCDGFYATAYTNGDRRRAMSEAVLETLDLEEEYGEPFSGERSIVQFNKNTNSASVTENTVEKTFILLPERRALKLSVSGDGSDITYANILTMPHLSRAVMDASRIFGIEGERIIVSEENSYSGYSLPSGDSTSGSLAWMNTSQSNTSANGEYTAIFAYGGHVVVFSKGSMQEIHGSAQPYRIIGIGSFGCVGQNAICEVEKKLYFVSENGVYSYAGAYPQKISGDLPIENFDGSILAGYGNKLYLYVPSKRTVYSYSTDTESFGIYQKISA